MNIFQYVTAMKELGTTFATVGISLLIAFLLFIIIKMLFGMKRGIKRQAVRTVLTGLSAIISYLVAVFFSNKIIGSLDVNSFDGLITRLEGVSPEAGEKIREFLANSNVELAEYILLIPATLILIPLGMVVVFLVLNLIFRIVGFIVTKVMRLGNAENNTQRLGGALLAVVEAVIWVGVIFLPLLGILNLADQTMNMAINEKDNENSAIVRVYDEYISPFSKNPSISFVDKRVSRRMYNGISTVTIHGERTNMRREILNVAHLVLIDASKLTNADFTHLTSEEKLAVENITEVFCDSPFMSNLMVGIVQSSASMIDGGIIEIEIGGAYEPLFDDLLVYLRGVSKESLKDDVKTIQEIYFTVSDSGVLSTALEGGDMMELLQEKRKEGDDTVNIIVDVLQENERTAPLVTSLTEALIVSLSSTVQVGDNVTITYEELKNDMNKVLAVDKNDYESTEEYMNELSITLDETLRGHGIEIEKEIVDGIAEYVDKEYSEKGEFTDEEFNDVILHYYDAYLNYVESGELPDEIPEDLRDKINEELPDEIPEIIIPE